jgi:hypothetical protein
LKPLALRPTRCPAIRPTFGAPASSARNESRIVLTVAVQRRDQRAARRGYAAAHRAGLAAGLRVAHAAQPGMQAHQPFQFGIGAVGGSVVDVNHLERPVALKRLGDFADQQRDVAGLVAYRHHNGHGRIVRIHRLGPTGRT